MYQCIRYNNKHLSTNNLQKQTKSKECNKIFIPYITISAKKSYLCEVSIFIFPPKLQIMRTLTILLGTMLCFGLSGCIKNEPLNTEADIVKCILPPGILKSDPLITNNTVLLLILPGTAEIDHLAPEFELTPGATIKPKSGTVRDFTTPQTLSLIHI